MENASSSSSPLHSVAAKAERTFSMRKNTKLARAQYHIHTYITQCTETRSLTLARTAPASLYVRAFIYITAPASLLCSKLASSLTMSQPAGAQMRLARLCVAAADSDAGPNLPPASSVYTCMPVRATGSLHCTH